MKPDIVGDQVRFIAACPGCGQSAPAQGGQALVFGRLEWSIETECPACGPIVACGRRDIPTELRERLLRHRPAQLELTRDGDDGRTAAIMKVIRSELALDLRATREMLKELQAGHRTGTLPEIEKLARALRASGVEARAVRQLRR